MINKNFSKIFEDVTGQTMNEFVGDSKIDNMVDELRRSTDIELKMFSASLINSNVNSFIQQYNTAQFEGFKEILGAIIDRYRVMDDAEKLDLFTKIELMFKDIMAQNFSALGQETAEIIASRYSKQMLQYLKSQNLDPQAATDTLYPHQRQLAAKADPCAAPSWQDKVQAKMASAEIDDVDVVDVMIANPY
jgi:hypothetical protein